MPPAIKSYRTKLLYLLQLLCARFLLSPAISINLTLHKKHRAGSRRAHFVRFERTLTRIRRALRPREGLTTREKSLRTKVCLATAVDDNLHTLLAHVHMPTYSLTLCCFSKTLDE